MINQVAPDLVNISTKEKLVSQSSQQYCQKLNFLFLTTDKYPSERADVVDLFVEEMVQRGHVIDWIQQSKLECIKPYRQKLGAGTVWVAPTDLGMSRIARLKKHLYALQNDLNMFSLARSNGYDFIQVMDRFLPAIMAIAVAKLNKTKFIFWLSFPFPEAYVYMAKEGLARYPSFYLIRGWFFKWILYKVILPAAYHIFVQSEQMKRDMFDMGISEEKITSVPMGVSLSKIPVTGMEESEELLDKNTNSVVYLGDLGKLRRIDFLLRVFKNILQEIPEAKLYLVGAAEDKQDIKKLLGEADQLGVKKSIEITGWLPKEEAWKYVYNAGVCVSPIEPTPIFKPSSPTKLIEYMALGKAVVANDLPDQWKVVTESGGGLCVAYEEKAFSQAVINLLKTPEMALEMGKKGRIYVEKHRSYKILADLVEQQYFRICKKRGNSSSTEFKPSNDI